MAQLDISYGVDYEPFKVRDEYFDFEISSLFLAIVFKWDDHFEISSPFQLFNNCSRRESRFVLQ